MGPSRVATQFSPFNKIFFTSSPTLNNRSYCKDITHTVTHVCTMYVFKEYFLLVCVCCVSCVVCVCVVWCLYTCVCVQHCCVYYYCYTCAINHLQLFHKILFFYRLYYHFNTNTMMEDNTEIYFYTYKDPDMVSFPKKVSCQ